MDNVDIENPSTLVVRHPRQTVRKLPVKFNLLCPYWQDGLAKPLPMSLTDNHKISVIAGFMVMSSLGRKRQELIQ